MKEIIEKLLSVLNIGLSGSKKLEAAIGVFRSALDQLSEAEIQLESEMTIAKDKISKLERELEKAVSDKDSINKIKDKINGLIGE